MMVAGKNVLIVGVTSDIGKELAGFYIKNGANVFGTYRSQPDFEKTNLNIRGIQLDLREADDVECLSKALDEAGFFWDLLILSAGVLYPISPFLTSDFGEWEEAFRVNFFGQLEVVKKIHQFHSTNASVSFFTGGAPGGVLKNYSSYSVAKIALTKMVEYLDDEDEEVKYYIVGPGWVDTKIHEQTMEAGKMAGDNLLRTSSFLKNNKSGTAMSDIYECINWLAGQEKSIVGGRNFSVVYDDWRAGYESDLLVAKLKSSPDMYKLRRLEISNIEE